MHSLRFIQDFEGGGRGGLFQDCICFVLGIPRITVCHYFIVIREQQEQNSAELNSEVVTTYKFQLW